MCTGLHVAAPRITQPWCFEFMTRSGIERVAFPLTFVSRGAVGPPCQFPNGMSELRKGFPRCVRECFAEFHSCCHGSHADGAQDWLWLTPTPSPGGADLQVLVYSVHSEPQLHGINFLFRSRMAAGSSLLESGGVHNLHRASSLPGGWVVRDLSPAGGRWGRSIAQLVPANRLVRLNLVLSQLPGDYSSLQWMPHP
jgi:hypothetical protein